MFEEDSGWRRIFVDLPGHGQTPAPRWLESQAQVVTVLREALLAILGDEPFAVAGNS